MFRENGSDFLLFPFSVSHFDFRCKQKQVDMKKHTEQPLRRNSFTPLYVYLFIARRFKSAFIKLPSKCVESGCESDLLPFSLGLVEFVTMSFVRIDVNLVSM